ncbi:voltage-dependent N-type calcium channel subunit alpha-1B [Striga asiatica]|uniref:Voltage-dependent N-type calcium channel subunit alpha-1B n=1 Tax=Striga asiatica TaxID=4170 RepID=A0A5A7QAI7_STRAF|nr:voltage-dependent N-type calcium channel subunit alpha-1B [Striga asiatica]
MEYVVGPQLAAVALEQQYSSVLKTVHGLLQPPGARSSPGHCALISASHLTPTPVLGAAPGTRHSSCPPQSPVWQRPWPDELKEQPVRAHSRPFVLVGTFKIQFCPESRRRPPPGTAAAHIVYGQLLWMTNVDDVASMRRRRRVMKEGILNFDMSLIIIIVIFVCLIDLLLNHTGTELYLGQGWHWAPLKILNYSGNYIDRRQRSKSKAARGRIISISIPSPIRLALVHSRSAARLQFIFVPAVRLPQSILLSKDLQWQTVPMIEAIYLWLRLDWTPIDKIPSSVIDYTFSN